MYLFRMPVVRENNCPFSCQKTKAILVSPRSRVEIFYRLFLRLNAFEIKKE